EDAVAHPQGGRSPDPAVAGLVDLRPEAVERVQRGQRLATLERFQHHRGLCLRGGHLPAPYDSIIEISRVTVSLFELNEKIPPRRASRTSRSAAIRSRCSLADSTVIVYGRNDSLTFSTFTNGLLRLLRYAE